MSNSQQESLINRVFEPTLERLKEWHASRQPTQRLKFVSFLNMIKRFCEGGKPKPSLSGSSRRFDGVSHAKDIRNGIDDRSSAAGTKSGANRSSSSQRSSLTAWLRGGAVHNVEDKASLTGSYFTDFTDLTTTTDASLPCIPLSHSRQAFKPHRRAISVNRRLWCHQDLFQPSYDHSYGERGERFNRVRDEFGDGTLALNPTMLRGIIRPQMFGDMCKMFQGLSGKEKEAFMDILRSIQFAREGRRLLTTNGECQNHEVYDRYWKPSRARSLLHKSDLNKSQVFLSSVNAFSQKHDDPHAIAKYLLERHVE